MVLSQTMGKPQYKFYTFLAMLYAVILAESWILMFKLVNLGPFLESGSVLFIPLMYIVEDIVAEVYGYKLARQLIWSSLFTSLIFCFMIKFTISLPSPSNWHHQEAFNYVLGNVNKEFIVGCIAILGGEFLNAYLITRWKVLLKGKYFWIRSVGSTAIGELFQSTVIYLGNFHSALSFSGVIHLIISAYLFKLLCAIILATPGMYIVSLLQKKEGISVYDYNVKFNPFKLSMAD